MNDERVVLVHKALLAGLNLDNRLSNGCPRHSKAGSFEDGGERGTVAYAVSEPRVCWSLDWRFLRDLNPSKTNSPN